VNSWLLAILAIVMIIHSARMIGRAVKAEPPRPSLGWRGWMMIGWLVIGVCALGAPRQLLWIAGACFGLAMFEKYVARTKTTGALSWLRFRWIVGFPLLLLKSVPSIVIFAIRRPRHVGELLRAIIAHYRLNLDHPLSRDEVDARSALSPQAALNLWRMEGKTNQRMEAAKLGVFFEAISKPETEKEKEAREQSREREARTKARNEEITALVATLPADSPVQSRRVVFRLAESETISMGENESIEVPPGEYEGLLSVGSLTEQEAEANDFFSLPCMFEFRHAGFVHRVASWMRCNDFYPTGEQAMNAPKFWWSEALPEWQRELRQGLLVTRQRVMNDCRERVPFPQAGSKHCLFTKYLTWSVDLAVSGDGRQLLVRVCNLFAERYKQDVEPAFREGTDPDFDDTEVMPPICLQIPIEEILPLTNPERHGTEEGDELVYKKRRMAEAQSPNWLHEGVADPRH
jgi:hypothetical protein